MGVSGWSLSHDLLGNNWSGFDSGDDWGTGYGSQSSGSSVNGLSDDLGWSSDGNNFLVDGG
jgi:hypothetical protein